MTAQKIKYNPRLFLKRAMDIQRRQLLLAMADAVSECRTAESMAAELNRDGETGLLRLAEIWCCLSPRHRRQDYGGPGRGASGRCAGTGLCLPDPPSFTHHGWHGPLYGTALYDGGADAGGMV